MEIALKALILRRSLLSCLSLEESSKLTGFGLNAPLDSGRSVGLLDERVDDGVDLRPLRIPPSKAAAQAANSTAA